LNFFKPKQFAEQRPQQWHFTSPKSPIRWRYPATSGPRYGSTHDHIQPSSFRYNGTSVDWISAYKDSLRQFKTDRLFVIQLKWPFLASQSPFDCSYISDVFSLTGRQIACLAKILTTMKVLNSLGPDGCRCCTEMWEVESSVRTATSSDASDVSIVAHAGTTVQGATS
jgi:hypothetical protein